MGMVYYLATTFFGKRYPVSKSPEKYFLYIYVYKLDKFYLPSFPPPDQHYIVH